MGFHFKEVQGNATQVKAELAEDTKNEREEKVLGTVTTAVDDIVEALGGYVSVNASGHVNPAEGETGDVVDIRIVSLPEPGGATPEEKEVPTGETSGGSGEGSSVTEPNEETLMTTEEALNAGGETREGGSVAPPIGEEAPGNSSGVPGIETSPVTENPETAPAKNPPLSEQPGTPESVPSTGGASVQSPIDEGPQKVAESPAAGNPPATTP